MHCQAVAVSHLLSVAGSADVKLLILDVFLMCLCLLSFRKLGFLALPVDLIAVWLDEMFFKLVLMLTRRLGDVAFCQAGRCLIMSHSIMGCTSDFLHTPTACFSP